MQVSAVAPDSLDIVWAALLPEIRKAMAGGTGVFLREEVRAGNAQMWVIHQGEDIRAGIVVSVMDGETGRKVFIDLLAGKDMLEWVDELESLLRAFKERTGANRIEAGCRPGLAKRLMSRGWKKTAVVMELQ